MKFRLVEEKYWNNEQNKKKHKNGLSPCMACQADPEKEINHFNNSTESANTESSEASVSAE